MQAMTIMLEGDVCLRTIEDNHGRLTDAIAAERSLKIDLGDATNADLSALQLLQSARDYAAAVGCDFALAAPAPPELAALLDRAGFVAAATPADIDFWFHGELPQ